MATRETILLFDSGLGGLTVYREVAAARPYVDFLYVADDAGFPYGDLPEPALVSRVVTLMGELIETHRPDLVEMCIRDRLSSAVRALASQNAGRRLPQASCR